MASTALERRRRAQLDQTLSAFRDLPRPPRRGWVRSLRTALGMTMRQMANRLELASASSVQQIETGEVDGALTLRRLQAAADALDCDLVYALVPREGTIGGTIRARARQVARETLLQADRHMVLEDQAVSAESLEHMVEELARDLEAGRTTRLWDDFK